MKDAQKLLTDSVMQLDKLYTQAAERAHLSRSEYDILYALDNFGDGCTQKDLGELCFASKQTVNSAIKRLIAKGYVTLTQGYGRSTHVTLTDAGYDKILTSVRPFMHEVNWILDQTDPDDLRTFLKWFRNFNTKLETALEDMGPLER